MLRSAGRRYGAKIPIPYPGGVFLESTAGHSWRARTPPPRSRAPGFITLLAEELGCSAVLDEAAIAGSITCDRLSRAIPSLANLNFSSSSNDPDHLASIVVTLEHELRKTGALKPYVGRFSPAASDAMNALRTLPAVRRRLQIPLLQRIGWCATCARPVPRRRTSPEASRSGRRTDQVVSRVAEHTFSTSCRSACRQDAGCAGPDLLAGSKTRRLEDSPARRLAGSKTRRLEDSPAQRHDPTIRDRGGIG
jgi:hypothetical protein